MHRGHKRHKEHGWGEGVGGEMTADVAGEGKRRRGPHGRGHGGGRGRVRRGAVANSALLLLSQKSMHGYEIIAELEDLTEGRWRPSPGAMYPALSRLEDKGFITGFEAEDGKRQYEITEAGQEWVAKRDADAPEPWAEIAESGGHGDLRSAAAELAGQVRQVGRFGTDEQRAAAATVLETAKKDLYRIMAE